MTEHREVEQTYAPGPDAVLPDLTTLPLVASLGAPEVVCMDAVYYDTPELALLRAGVTLRRRTGGGDEGWHAKLPAGAGRDEIRLPLGTGTTAPPAELLEVVRGWTRGAPVGVVATIETRRTERALHGRNGDVLAELAEDEVTGRPSGRGGDVVWREWELELVGGGPDLLKAADDLMGRAGVRPSKVPRKLLHVIGDRLPEPRPAPRTRPGKPAGRVLQVRLAEQVAELHRRDAQIRRGQPEGVHQARVACRRLRGALATFRPLVRREVTDAVREELRWFGRSLSDARDAKVVRERLTALLDEEPSGLVDASARSRLAAAYGEIGRAAAAEIDEVLGSDRYFALLDALDRLVDDPPWTTEAARPAGQVLPARVRRDWKRLGRSLAAVQDAPESDPAWHQARKDAKRLRYAAETLEPAWGKDARRLANAAKRLTVHLGDRQDTVVSRQHLRAISERAEAAGESSFPWGRLHAREQHRAEALDEAFDDLWTEVSRRRLRRWLRT